METETANLKLLHDLFNLRCYGRSEFLLCIRRQVKAVSAIVRDDRAGVKEVGAPKARNAFRTVLIGAAISLGRL